MIDKNRPITDYEVTCLVKGSWVVEQGKPYQILEHGATYYILKTGPNMSARFTTGDFSAPKLIVKQPQPVVETKKPAMTQKEKAEQLRVSDGHINCYSVKERNSVLDALVAVGVKPFGSTKNG